MRYPINNQGRVFYVNTHFSWVSSNASSASLFFPCILDDPEAERFPFCHSKRYLEYIIAGFVLPDESKIQTGVEGVWKAFNIFNARNRHHPGEWMIKIIRLKQYSPILSICWKSSDKPVCCHHIIPNCRCALWPELPLPWFAGCRFRASTSWSFWFPVYWSPHIQRVASRIWALQGLHARFSAHLKKIWTQTTDRPSRRVCG